MRAKVRLKKIMMEKELVFQTHFMLLDVEKREVTIESTDGNKLIYNAKTIFKAGINSEFNNWPLTKKGPETKKTLVSIYELFRDGFGKEVFNSFGVDLEELVLTQNQINNFCETQPDWFCDDHYMTLFLAKEDSDKPAINENLLVVFIGAYSDGLYIFSFPFDTLAIGRGNVRHFVVVPQIIKS